MELKIRSFESEQVSPLFLHGRMNLERSGEIGELEDGGNVPRLEGRGTGMEKVN